MDKPDFESLPDALRYLETQRYAYGLWEQRGRPWGSPEVDWFAAERYLKGVHPTEPSPLVAAAAAVGSLVGSVVGFALGETTRSSD